jgi:hypothetical protein
VQHRLAHHLGRHDGVERRHDARDEAEPGAVLVVKGDRREAEVDDAVGHGEDLPESVDGDALPQAPPRRDGRERDEESRQIRQQPVEFEPARLAGILDELVDPGTRVDCGQRERHPLERLPAPRVGDGEHAAVQHQEIRGEEDEVPVSGAGERGRQVSAQQSPDRERLGVVAQRLRRHGRRDDHVEPEGQTGRNHTVLLLAEVDGDEQQPVARRHEPRRKALPTAPRVDLAAGDERRTRQEPERHATRRSDPVAVHGVREKAAQPSRCRPPHARRLRAEVGRR